MIPCTWCKGSTWMRWSAGVYSQALARHSDWNVMFLWVVTQPLGFEVVPDVYIINARLDWGREVWNGGKGTGDFVLATRGIRSKKGISGQASRMAGFIWLNEGWRMINEGSESVMVYMISFVGWVVPVMVKPVSFYNE
ncbi:hypothetical protein ACKS0A_07370 [Histoplasma ohiense]